MTYLRYGFLWLLFPLRGEMLNKKLVLDSAAELGQHQCSGSPQGMRTRAPAT